MQHTLRDAATQTAYFDYLTEKFQGVTSPDTNIHWQTLRYTLKKFKSAERRTITKFIHEWLPLLDRHHVIGTSREHLCPSCRQAAETVDHFFECQQQERATIWKELHDHLQQHQIKNTVSNTFHDLLAYGLYQGRSEPTDITFHHAPADIKQLYQAQERLGWRQLYYGRISPLWIIGIQTHHQQVNGTHYYAQGLKLIWKAVLQVWRLRNQHLHPSSHEQEDRSLLEAAVRNVFQEAQQDPLLRDMIAHTTTEQILSKPTRQVRQWVTNSNNHIRAHRKASQLRAKLQTHDIRQFFPKRTTTTPPHTADKNLLRPP